MLTSMAPTTTQPPPQPAPAGGQEPRPAKILLVEDNRDILRATERLLATQKYTVVTATDGEEALREAHGQLPDLILLDVMIPRVDGLEVCRRLKADPRTSGIMIIHVTGRGSVDNRVQGLDAGADDYIPKPFHIPELLARVRSALRIKALTDDLAERNHQLLKSQKDLVQSEKMATIGLLAAGIAHEFNNIMAGISGYAQLARRDARYKDKLVEVAMIQTERAMELTRSLSSYNRVAADGECDVVPTIESALCLVAKQAESTNARVVTAFLERPRVSMSPGRLQELVLNLVLNALQALREEGGVIRIKVEPAVDAGSFVIEVADNGQGIAAQHIEHIFDPFFTTKGALGGGRQSGTGLGLTVCYNLVESAGGRIEVASAPDKGATFRITLPRVEAAAANAPVASPVEPRSAPSGAPRKLRILVVDDEVTIRELLREQLRGHDVVCCGSGETALEAYAVRPFDYVLLDVCMERSMNGFQLFDRFARFSPPPRVIFASGRHPDAAYQSYLQKAHGHLQKPFQLEALLRLLGLPVPPGSGQLGSGQLGSGQTGSGRPGSAPHGGGGVRQCPQ